MIEAVLLTGGASRRMGSSKADAPVDGVPMARRIAQALLDEGMPVTVLGREPLSCCRFLPDAEEYAGPSAALARFEPAEPRVFVASCDLARFDARLPAALAAIMADQEAAAPVLDGRAQPLCAVYSAEAFAVLRRLTAAGERRLMPWFDALRWRPVTANDLAAAGLDPRCVQSANTPDELRALLTDP